MVIHCCLRLGYNPQRIWDGRKSGSAGLAKNRASGCPTTGRWRETNEQAQGKEVSGNIFIIVAVETLNLTLLIILFVCGFFNDDASRSVHEE
jgi:hypothetical protein